MSKKEQAKLAYGQKLAAKRNAYAMKATAIVAQAQALMALGQLNKQKHRAFLLKWYQARRMQEKYEMLLEKYDFESNCHTIIFPHFRSLTPKAGRLNAKLKKDRKSKI